MNFDRAVELVLRHEGGFVDHPSDPGGATMYGVTQAVARANGYDGPMREMPIEVARTIYRARYWDAVRADEMPEPLRYPLFDAAVNSGAVQAIRWLQVALNVKADGVIGPITLQAARTMPVERTRARMIAARLRMMSSLQHWPAFGRGWARRIADVMEAA